MFPPRRPLCVCLNLYDGFCCSTAPTAPHTLTHFNQVSLQVSVETSVSNVFLSSYLFIFTLCLGLLCRPGPVCPSVYPSVRQLEMGRVCRQARDSRGAEGVMGEMAQSERQRFRLRENWKVSSCPLPPNDHRL